MSTNMAKAYAVIEDFGIADIKKATYEELKSIKYGLEDGEALFNTGYRDEDTEDVEMAHYLVEREMERREREGTNH